MATWDIFHADRLELERGLSSEAVRAALAAGALHDDDLVRPAGTTVPWSRIAEIPELLAPPAARPAEDFENIQPRLEDVIPPEPRAEHQRTELPGSPSSSDVAFPVLDEDEEDLGPPAPTPGSGLGPPPAWVWDDDEDEDEDEDEDNKNDIIGLHDRPPGVLTPSDMEILAEDAQLQPPPSSPARPARPDEPTPGVPSGYGTPRVEPGKNDLDFESTRSDSRSSHTALPTVRARIDDDAVASPDGGDEDEDASFSLSRRATQTIEELDLAPMVDVAFNLVLFFMVTASTVLFKTLEIPKPSGEAPAGAVAQGRSRSLDDLKDDYILVEIDGQGGMKLDREPIAASMETLVEALRRARETTGRKSMLLSAEFTTPHRNAVLAYDAANEIGLGIAIARPRPPLGPAPALRAAPPTAPAPAPAPASTPF